MNYHSDKKHSFFKISKKAIACSMAIAAISATSVLQAAAPSAVATKFKSVQADRAIAGQYIVKLKDQFVDQQVTAMGGQLMTASAAMEHRRSVVANMAQEMSNLHGANIKRQYHTAISGFVAQMSNKEMRAMLSHDSIDYIEQDQAISINATQNGATWGLDRIDQADLPLDSTYTYTNDGSGVNAYVIDTGILVSHSDFNGRAQNGFDFVDNDSVAQDCNGHGTHVAGTVGSSTYGVAKNVTLHAVRVLDCGGGGTTSGVIAGIDWVAANAVHPAVANMSLGGGNSTALDSSVQSAIASGITFAVAAGNSNSDACSGSPNRVPEALTVASSTSSDARSSFSSWGSCIDLFAPGSSITSTWNNGGTNTISGTSMAAPHVAGVAALYLQTDPSASPATVNAAVTGNAISGRISNVNGSPNLLLQSEFGGTPPPPPPPPPGNVLDKGVAVTGLSDSRGGEVFYTMDIPAGATNLNFDISGGSGDADLYVKFGSAPTTSSWDCRPYRSGNVENCNFANPSAGTYHVMLRAYSSYSGASLVGDYTAGGGGGGGTFFENTDNVSIPDNNSTGITSDINVTRTGQAGTIDVAVDIKHTWIGDLIVDVISPSGAVTNLHNRSGGSANDILQTYTVNAGSTGANGVWKLRVRDRAGRDTGYIDAWSITF